MILIFVFKELFLQLPLTESMLVLVLHVPLLPSSILSSPASPRYDYIKVPVYCQLRNTCLS